ncbi:Sulfatase-modifying factor enzyme domain-containing protein [Desulfonema limicola]|uniref:Sulfatase-modifying factor enzyme domain-containing protein n=1 Tax=Desulfonema limicola TaxID=45656 RepID=A0A975GIQ1_9BACT|nr:SUMF1/EgtB/PvdO family nonheme iron enzyme [Desulfonema limicola]QTA82797.1 Sulfatase-modifying factor enzyme domain-containing protein [Desulfonema limicola]
MEHEQNREYIFAKISKAANYFQRNTQGGLLFCDCDNPRLSQVFSRQIIISTKNMGLDVKEVFLSSDNISNFIKRIRGAAEKADGLIINNFDELIRISGVNAIRELNQAREVLLELGIPLLFWLSPGNISMLANKAADIFTRRSRAVVSFSDISFDQELEWLETAISQQAKLGDIVPKDILQAALIGLRAQRDTLKSMIEELKKAPGTEPDTVNIDVNQSNVAVIGNNTRIFGNVYMGEPVSDPDEALKIYCRVMTASFRNLPLRGVDLGASDPGRGQYMELAQVYVDLNTQTQVEIEESKGSREKTRLLRALEASIKNRQLVILGDPGSGKSTFVNHLALCLGCHIHDPYAGWIDRLKGWPDNEANAVPVLVVLRDFARWLAGDETPEPRLLWKFIVSRLEAKNLGFASDAIHKVLENGRAVVLLDGLDEIPTQAQKSFVRDAVAAFAGRYENSRFIVTCRVLSYQDPAWQLKDFPVFELAPFNDEMISRFIDAWYSELVRIGELRNEQQENMTWKLKNAVKKSDLRRLAENPLLLTVMALVNTHKGELPEARALLYEDTVDILLWRWDQLKSESEKTRPRLKELIRDADRTDVDLKKVLWKLAFQAHEQGGKDKEDVLADIKEWQLVKALSELHPAKSMDWANQVIETIKYRAGLLIEREPGLYSFPHRTFQEYLAGAYLSSQGNFAETASSLAGQGNFWREVILLATGRLVYLSGDLDKPLALVYELCHSLDKKNEAAWHKIWLAGDVLLETGLNRIQDSAMGRDLYKKVQQELVNLVQAGALKPVERVEAGNTLGRLGDIRFRKDAWFLPDEPLLGFVEIPAGEFWMGDDNIEYSSPKHNLDLPAFYMARYPVTVEQFRVFVEDSGYESDDNNSLKGMPNHPVKYVKGYDGAAYCNWLTETLKEWKDTPEPLASLLRENKMRFCLSTEAQWEKAARGTDGRVFPWGNTPDPDCANYMDTKIRTTSPAGCFPKGASPFGCMDMAGNVWEWTRSLWGKDWDKPDFKYPYNCKDGREDETDKGDILLIVRGGSYFGDSDDVRCATRYKYFPVNWDDLRGFRVSSVVRSQTDL